MATNVKVGDKVRFMNTVGGGIVTGFKSKGIIIVEEEDGFETPCLISDVVVIQETDQYNFPVIDPVKEINDKRKRQGQQENKYIEEEDDEEEDIKIPEYTWNERDETKEGEKLSIYLAFVPHDIKQLQTTDMDLYIINDSNYYLQFALYSGAEQTKLRCHNMIEPQTKLNLETINKIALNDLENLRFQGFSYKNIAFEVKPVMDISLKINPTKFYKLHSFRENDYFDEDAMLVTIVKDDVMDLGMMIDPNKLQKAIAEKKDTQDKFMVKHHKKQPKDEIIEVDLHIEQLLDHLNGLSRRDMLLHQLGVFEKTMKENLKKKGQKIVFIHGKGDGVLRAEIEKLLKNKYHKCEFQDASFQQYGFGATQVTIH